ncbi:solute carrier family 66 member 3-like [Ruditapes philippinarum]|uniref:solute carrier family 66 member 3-like n=1 Tax=Ruditapes philippinarum TaxID=129788 RepID=UPI00295BE55E|nr:solute carrier family 66 member 3-like [Ruditapes philippinarum]
MEASAYLENICNFLSMTVVALCIIMKVPQIWSAFKSGNTKGISLGSVMLEQSGYSILLSYSYAMEYPIGTYLETAFLLLQNFLLLGLIIHTRDMLSPKVFILFVLYMVVYLSIAYRLVPDFILKSVISLNMPLGVSSKLTQIVALYKSKDPGRLSAVTWSIAGYGCYVRILTSFVQTGDIFIILSFTCGATLNTTIVFMILYYTHIKSKKLY